MNDSTKPRNSRRRNSGAGNRKGSNSQYGRRNYQKNGNGETDTNNKSAVKGYAPIKEPNDADWYATNPQLLEDAGRLSFNNALGNMLTPLTGTPLPGIMAIETVSLPGNASNNSDPINIAARKLFTDMRRWNAGSVNYLSPDLMLYVLGVSDAYAFASFMRRAYGLMTHFSQVQKYTPEALFAAMHLDYSDFKQHVADFRKYINIFTSKLNAAFKVPSNLNYFKRAMFMYESIYVDAPTTKAAYFLYTPRGFHYYSETTNPQGGELIFHPLYAPTANLYGSSTNTWQITSVDSIISYADLVKYGDDMLEALQSSEDLNIMSGDILKACGDNGVWQIGTVDDDYTTPIIYSEEVLMQMHNTVVVPIDEVKWASTSNITNLDITQDAERECIKCNARIAYYRPSNAALNNIATITALPLLLDLPMENPTPADVMVASRMHVRGVTSVISPDTAPGRWDADIMGTELAVHCYMYRGGGNSSYVPGTSIPLYQIECPTVVTSTYPNSILLGGIQFNRAPVQYMANNNGSSIQAVASDIDNYTLVHDSTLKKLHECAIMSLFDIAR